MPGDIFDIVVVLNDSDRSTQFPTPGTNQRVQNLATGNIERYNGSAWVTDFLGDLTIISNPSTTDYGPAIKAAIATANAAGGGTVYIPAGSWPILTPIDFQSATNVTLKGVGLGTTLACQMASPNTGSIVATSTTRCAIRDLRLTGAGTSSTTNGLIYAQNATSLTIDHVRFEGGGQLFLNTCKYSTVSHTSHTGTTIPGSACIYFYQCTSCSLINPIVEPFIFPTSSAATRAIVISNSTDVSVIGGSLNGFDMSQTGNGVGFSFSGSSHCTLTGMTVTGLLGADGIACEAGASYITISNCDSSNNDTTAGANPSYTGTGDGFDIFDSSHIRISNCIAQNNGAHGGHPGFEIFTCAEVTVSNCLSMGNHAHGFLNAGTTDLTLEGCVAIGNGADGVYALQAGTPTVQPTNLRIIGGDYSGNNTLNNTTSAWLQNGIYLSNSCTATIIGIRATDPNATKLQQWGIRIENSAVATIIGCSTSGNVNAAGILDSVNQSHVLATDTTGAIKVISGSRSGNAALGSLLTALSQLNIIHDGTTP